MQMILADSKNVETTDFCTAKKKKKKIILNTTLYYLV